jgi:hypothetical protein
VKRSLSVFIPIHETNRWLDSVVSELLEVLSDLTPRLELILLDDGNEDDVHAAEAAHELARGYPQAKVVRPAVRAGRASTLRAGLSRSQGEVILLWNEGCRASAQEFGKMWKLIDEYAAVIAHAGADAREDWSRRLLGKGKASAVNAIQPGNDRLLMVHRQVAERLWVEGASRGDDLKSIFSRRGYRWCELDLGTTGSGRHGPAIDEVGNQRGERLRTDAPAASHPSSEERSKVRRPRYLDRLKKFAWGE